MLKTTLALAIATILSGCAGISSIVDRAANINDKALEAAEFSICQGASIGSVKRRFNTPELARLWQDFCREGQGFIPNTGE